MGLEHELNCVPVVTLRDVLFKRESGISCELFLFLIKYIRKNFSVSVMRMAK
jgi:hypothetical protein